MALFPITTENDDGTMGLGSLIIIGVCFLAFVFVVIELPRAERRVQEAVSSYREAQYQLQYNDTASFDTTGDTLAAQMRAENDSVAVLRMEQGADSVANRVRQASLVYQLAFTPARFNIISPITSMFLHSSWKQMIGNLAFFYACGVAMEKYWGLWRFLFVYLGCGVTAVLTFMGFCAVDWPRWGNTPYVGAIGAIAGTMGAFLITHTKEKMIIKFGGGTYKMMAWQYLGLWFLSQIVFMILDFKHYGGLAYSASIGGFLAGIALGKFVKGEDEVSLIQPAAAGRGAVRRAVLPDGLIDRDPLTGMKSRNLSISEQAAEREARAIRREAGPRVSQSETEGLLAMQRGDQAAAARNLVNALDNYLQAPQERRDAIASVLSKIMEANPPLPIPAAQLYQWAKGIYTLDMKELSLACLDRASLDTSNPHIQKNSMLNAAAIRIQTNYQLESAAAGLQKLLSIEPTGVIANQAKQYLGQLQQIYHSPT